MYRKDNNKKLLFFVPRSMETNVIRTCHDDIGHVGVDKTVSNISSLLVSKDAEKGKRAYRELSPMCRVLAHERQGERVPA